MPHLPRWGLFWLTLAFLLELANRLFFPQTPDISWAELLFPSEMFYFFNPIGVYFGISALILWGGKRLPLSDRTMLILMAIGVGSFLLMNVIQPYEEGNAAIMLAVILWAIGAAAVLLWGYLALRGVLDRKGLRLTRAEKLYIKEFFFLTMLSCALVSATNTVLRLFAVLFPQTMDLDLYRIDLAYHGFAGMLFAGFDLHWSPFVKTVVMTVYNLLSIVLLFLLAPTLREGRMAQLHALRLMLVPFLLASVLYAFNPVAGPPAFAGRFPYDMAWIVPLGYGTDFVPPSFRNGMPSMHFTGAMLMVLIAAALTRKIYFYATALFAAITFIATMAIGEHYLIDLIVAAPYCIALGTALMNPPGWHFYKRRIWWANTACFVMWELLLHFAATRVFLIENPLFVQLFSALSVLVAVWGFAAFLRTVWYLPPPQTAGDSVPHAAAVMAETAAGVPLRWVSGLFVCSGFAGLLYEVVFAKHLGVIFGGTSLAAYTVMATYMGGMALGAWLGGILADRVRSPLKWYAVAEGAIGIYALATPALFKLIAHIYAVLAADVRPDAPVLTLWRVLLGVIVLGIPTILMGTTLPIVFKFLRGYLPGRGNLIARLYTANIIGAAFGALAGAYAVLPTLGLASATRLAALVSLMIALYAIDRLKTLPAPASGAMPDAMVTGHVVLPPQSAWQQRRLGIAALLLVSIGGVVTLALEIVNMHLLAIVAGNSAYAFGLMLATFLLGLGLGGAAYDKLRQLLTAPVIAAAAQLGIFFTIILAANQWNGLVGYFASFEPMEHYHHFGFAARELIRAAVCAIIMMPSAFFIGLGYPAAMALASAWLKNRGDAAGLGIAALCNTLGNIVGVLLAGFVLLNWLGSNRLLLLLAVISLLLACYMAYTARALWPQAFRYNSPVQSATAAATAAAVLLALWVYPAQWDMQQLSSGANVYFTAGARGEVIDARESIQGGLTTVNRQQQAEGNGSGHAVLTLLTNGKFQGNNAGEVTAQKAFARIPLLHQPQRADALVIGYGTGNSAYTLHEQGFALDIAELTPDIVALADKHFADINGRVSQQQGVHMYYTDGRNYLLTQNKRYDLISMELTSIWFAGAANLYNREFYQLAKSRLKEDGVLQQWVQMHHMRAIDLLYILNTLHQEFRYVWLYVSGGQGILVASDSEKAAQLYHLDGRAADSIAALNEEEKALHDSLLLEPADMDYLAQKLRVPQFLVSTDNNLYLEYATPKGNAITYDSLATNIDMLTKLRQEQLQKQGESIPESGK